MQVEKQNIAPPSPTRAVAPVENMNGKMSYEWALEEYNRLNRENTAENRRAAIISIVCVVVIFGVANIILNFFDGHMFTRYYSVRYDIGFLSDFAIAIIASITFWGGWVVILKLLFNFGAAIWGSRRSLTGFDIGFYRSEAEEILQNDPSRVAEAEALIAKADYLTEILTIVDRSKL